MKVLYLINYAGKGGAEKYVKIFAEYLLKKNNEVFLVYNEDGLLREDMESIGCKIYKLNMRMPFDFKAAKKLSEICKYNNIDIVHAQFPRENYIALLSQKFGSRVEVIYTAHLNIYNNVLWRLTNKVLTKRNKYIIAVCNSVKYLLIKNKYPVEKINTIFNGVEYKENLIFEKSYIREEFNIDIKEFIFVTITRFSEEKGIFYLLKSVKELIKITKYSFKLIFVGDGKLLADAKNYVIKNKIENYIIFAGYRKDTIKFLDASNVFINSSKIEALSFAIIEALSRNIPVIVTNVGGNKDIVDKDSKHGILVDYKNIKSMANAMKLVLEDKNLYYNMVEHSKLIIKSKFNLEKTLFQTYNLYQNALKGAKNDH